MTDQEYIQAVRVNDQKIIGQIYSRFRSSTLGYLRKHTTLDEGDICDVYQEALIVVVNKVFQDGFELSSSLSTFIVSIARNIAMNRLRKNNHTVSLDADLDPVLCKAANTRAHEIGEYFSDIRPPKSNGKRRYVYRNFDTAVKKKYRFSLIAENIGLNRYNAYDAMHDLVVSSRLVTSDALGKIGIGYDRHTGAWVEMYVDADAGMKD